MSVRVHVSACRWNRGCQLLLRFLPLHSVGLSIFARCYDASDTRLKAYSKKASRFLSSAHPDASQSKVNRTRLPSPPISARPLSTERRAFRDIMRFRFVVVSTPCCLGSRARYCWRLPSREIPLRQCWWRRSGTSSCLLSLAGRSLRAWSQVRAGCGVFVRKHLSLSSLSMLRVHGICFCCCLGSWQLL